MTYCTLHMYVSCRDCVEFRDEILLRRRGGERECETRENSNFLRKGNTINSVENQEIL